VFIEAHPRPPGSPFSSIKISPSQVLTSSLALRQRKPFGCNTYQSPRKCCKQKTYGLAKPFRCNTYKKTGGTSFKPRAFHFFAPRSLQLLSVPPCLCDWSVFHLPYTLPSSVSCKSFACHSYENTGGVGVFFPFWNSSLATRRFHRIVIPLSLEEPIPA